jgi:membrane dipeptidase
MSTLTPTEARALHDEVCVLDLHADTAKLMDKLGYDLAKRHERVWPRGANMFGHVDLPRLRDGGVAGQFFAFWAMPPLRDKLRDRAHGSIDAQLRALEAAVEKHGDEIAWTRTGADVRAAKAAGKLAAFGAIEGGQALDGKLEAIEPFSRRGVRYLGLLHLWSNGLGGTSRNDPDRALTPFGADVIRECERCGVIIDLAHINRIGFFEALKIATRPVMVTHTGVSGVHKVWRNLDDDQIKAVAENGGCIGIIFAKRWLGGASIDAVVDHVAHVIDVAGEDVPALGSDFDGAVVPTDGLEDVAAMPNLTVALSKRFPVRVVEKIVGGNVLRVLDAVPAYGTLGG